MERIKGGAQQVMEISLPYGMTLVIDSDKFGVQLELWATSKVRLDCRSLYIEDGKLLLKE